MIKSTFNFKERFHKKKPKAPTGFYCRLKIDGKTSIFIRTKESLIEWMEKYPNAVKLDTTI